MSKFSRVKFRLFVDNCYFTPWEFFHISVSWCSFSEVWVAASLPQVSRTLLSILADLNNVVVWIFSTRFLISNSSSPFNNPLVTVSRTPITVGINVTFMFRSFFSSLILHLDFFQVSCSTVFQFSSKVQGTYSLFTFFQFYSVVSRDSKVHNSASSLFCWLL